MNLGKDVRSVFGAKHRSGAPYGAVPVPNLAAGYAMAMVGRVSSPSLIGRRDELRRLESVMDQTRSGLPGIVIVAGEAGVGKSRLVSELDRSARARGLQTLVGDCVRMSGDVAPFAPVVQALRQLLATLGPASTSELIGPNPAGLGAFLPDVSAASPAPRATGISPDTATERLFERFLGLIGRLTARAPCLLVVEDIQWADQSTLDLLAFLSRNLRNEPLMVVVTLRTDEPDRRPATVQFLAELLRQARVERVDLDRLSRKETIDQLEAILGSQADAGIIDVVYTRSQGNPFFAEELLAAHGASDALPETLRDVLIARIASLTAAARQLVRVASAAGNRFSESLLARLSRIEDSELQVALREAIDHHVLVRESGPRTELLRFRHALVQELLDSELLSSERIRLHATCATVIEAEPGWRSDAALAAELAYHWNAANQPRRALHASIAAGLAAQAAEAETEAGQQFEKALRLLESHPAFADDLPLSRIALLEHAASNARGDPTRAIGHIRTAIGLADPIQDPMQAGLLHVALGRYLWFAGDGAGALAACEEAVRLVPAQPPTVARARATAALAQIQMILADFESAVPIAEESVRLAAATNAPAVESHALNTLGTARAYIEAADTGLALLHRALSLARECGSPDDVSRAQGNIVDALVVAGRFDDAFRFGLESLNEQHGTTFYAVFVLEEVALALYRLGRWNEVMDVLDRAQAYEDRGVGGVARIIRLAQVEVSRGQFDQANAHIAALQPFLERAADTQWLAPAAEARAELAIWRGNPGEALDILRATFGQLPPTVGANVSRIGPLHALAIRAAADFVNTRASGRRLRREVGRSSDLDSPDATRNEAANHLRAIRSLRDQIAARAPAHLHLADPYLVLCEAEWTRVDGTPSPAAWSRAAELFATFPIPYSVAYCWYREAAALLASRGDPTRARERLRQAHSSSLELGATPLVSAIEHLAARARITVGPGVGAARQRGAAGLTAREMEILRLLSEGRTNRQIGETLFITEKTASHHVSNILSKLGVAGRGEAVAAAARLGLTGEPI